MFVFLWLFGGFHSIQDARFRCKTCKSVQCLRFRRSGRGRLRRGGGGRRLQHAVEEAGIIAQTYLPDFPYTLVKSTTKQLAVNYFDGEKMCYCVNVNGPLITLRTNVENVSPQVVDKLADYIEEHGKITDKTLLKQILGEDYADNYYKFFVSMDDYEKIG